MKAFITAGLMFCINVAFAHTVPAQQPIEQQYHVNYWWWITGVLLAIGAGVIVYMLIKKDPKRDAVR